MQRAPLTIFVSSESQTPAWGKKEPWHNETWETSTCAPHKVLRTSKPLIAIRSQAEMGPTGSVLFSISSLLFFFSSFLLFFFSFLSLSLSISSFFVLFLHQAGPTSRQGSNNAMLSKKKFSSSPLQSWNWSSCRSQAVSIFFWCQVCDRRQKESRCHRQ